MQARYALLTDSMQSSMNLAENQCKMFMLLQGTEGNFRPEVKRSTAAKNPLKLEKPLKSCTQCVDCMQCDDRESLIVCL